LPKKSCIDTILIIIMILTRKIFSRFSKLEAGRLYTWTKK